MCSPDANHLQGMTKIEKNRSCTDIFLFLVWLLSWAGCPLCFLFGLFCFIGALLILSLAKSSGANVWAVVRGTDLEDGGICGLSVNQTSNPYLAWPNPVDFYNATICVPSCDATNNYGNPNASSPVLTRMVYRYSSTQVGFYCLPTASALSLLPSVSVQWQDSGITEQCSKAASDVATTWIGILVAIIGSVIVSFILIIFLGKCASCIFFCAISFIMIGAALISAFLIWWGLDSTHKIAEPNIAKASLVIGAILACLFFIFLCVLLAMINRIKIALGIVKEASYAIGDMKSIICFPIFPFMLAVIYLAIWLVAMLYVWSVIVPDGSVPTPSGLRQLALFPSSMWSGSKVSSNGLPNSLSLFQRPYYWQRLSAYLVFHALWQFQFLFYFGYLTFAGATADWYFTPRDQQVSLCSLLLLVYYYFTGCR